MPGPTVSGHAPLPDANDMTVGSPLKKIVRFAWPLLIGNVFQQLYNVVDSIVVGNFVGTVALAAVGVCTPVIFLFFSLFAGLSSAASVLVSHEAGAKDADGVRRVISTSYRCIILGFLPMIVLCLLLSKPFLTLIDVRGAVLEQATLYLRIFFLGTLANLGFNMNAGILRGLGDSIASLKFLAVSCIANVALDVLFVAGFGWGVGGVAVATVIAQYASWLLSHCYLRRHYNSGGDPFFRCQATPSVTRGMLRLGLPAAFQHMAFSFGVLLIQALINRQDTAFLAGFNAAGRIDLFAFMPIQSFTLALTAYTGQNFGAGDFARIRAGIRAARNASLLLDAALVGLVLLFGRQLLALFSRDPAVLAAGWAYLVRIMPFYFVLTVASMYAAIMRGAGVVLIPTLIMMVSLWIGRVPAAYLMEHFFGRDNIFFCYGVGWLLDLILNGIYYYTGRWKRKFITGGTIPDGTNCDYVTDHVSLL